MIVDAVLTRERERARELHKIVDTNIEEEKKRTPIPPIEHECIENHYNLHLHQQPSIYQPKKQIN
jgi:hypothetical protein